jgi:hypothetical protein
MCAERSFLLVGDSKLVSFDNLLQIIAAGVSFIAPASKLYVDAEVLAGCDFDTATPVDYVAQRDTDKAADRRCRPRHPEAGHPGLTAWSRAA